MNRRAAGVVPDLEPAREFRRDDGIVRHGLVQQDRKKFWKP
jgi:hypothetical protein